MSTMYELAKEIYAKYGVDTDAAIAKCKEIPVALHCWQGDDVIGFDNDGGLTNFISMIKAPDFSGAFCSLRAMGAL